MLLKSIIEEIEQREDRLSGNGLGYRQNLARNKQEKDLCKEQFKRKEKEVLVTISSSPYVPVHINYTMLSSSCSARGVRQQHVDHLSELWLSSMDEDVSSLAISTSSTPSMSGWSSADAPLFPSMVCTHMLSTHKHTSNLDRNDCRPKEQQTVDKI